VEEIQGAVIRFNKVTGDEKGQYVCTAENIAGTSTAIATVDVRASVVISVLDHGESLVCTTFTSQFFSVDSISTQSYNHS